MFISTPVAVLASTLSSYLPASPFSPASAMDLASAMPLSPVVEIGDVRPGVKKALRQFSLAGRQMAVSAYGRNASADTPFHRATYREAQVMDRVMPGYPQPPRLTIEIRLLF